MGHIDRAPNISYSWLHSLGLAHLVSPNPYSFVHVDNGPTSLSPLDTKVIQWDIAFNLKELGQLKGQEVQIILEDNNLIFTQLYKLSEVERTLVHA
jgi:hypothetical protein